MYLMFFARFVAFLLAIAQPYVCVVSVSTYIYMFICMNKCTRRVLVFKLNLSVFNVCLSVV